MWSHARTFVMVCHDASLSQETHRCKAYARIETGACINRVLIGEQQRTLISEQQRTGEKSEEESVHKNPRASLITGSFAVLMHENHLQNKLPHSVKVNKGASDAQSH